MGRFSGLRRRWQERLQPLRAVLMAPRLFCHEGYARTYLGSSWLAPFAMAHYLLSGERRGYPPNPFFTPGFFERRANSRSFLRYLASPGLWSIPTSERFDPAWYRRQANCPDSVNPLVDFWCRGFENKVSPAAGFDMNFFRYAVCTRTRPRRFTYELFARRCRVPPVNPSQFRSQQDRFIALLSYDVRTRKSAAPLSCLLFVQAGAGFDAAYLHGTRSFDVLLNYYEEPQRAQPADYVVVQTGTKTTAIRQILRNDPALLLRYDFVLFLDDDVGIDCAGIETLFERVRTHALDLAQASLSASSSCFHPALKQPLAGRTVRAISGVEIMMPVLSRRVLQQFGWVFSQGISGWALDFLLSTKVRETFGNTIAVIGDVVASHERPVDTETGRYYTYLQSHDIDPSTEAKYIIKTHGLDKYKCGFQFMDERTPLPEHACYRVNEV